MKSTSMPPNPTRLFMVNFLFYSRRGAVRLLCLSVLGLVSPRHGRGAESPLPWRAGAATTVITPKTNLWLAGYAARTKPAEGVAQELYAKALAITDAQEGRFVFVTLDAIGVPRSMRKNLETRLASAYQLKPHELVITASHSHSTPEFRAARVPVDDRGSVEAGHAYADKLESAIETLVGDALRALAPARLSYARARAGFAMNRRLPQPRAEPVNAPNPDGPVDHDVPVLRVEGTDGQLRAILFGYACHNTSLTQTSYVFCGDYAGFAQEYLQADHPGAVALFMTGCGGDQNPYPRSALDYARRHGRSLAMAVEAALVTKARLLTGTLQSAYAEIELRYSPPPSRAEFQRRLDSPDKTESAHARRMLDRLDKEGGLPVNYPYPLQVLHLGELKLVALGGEAVVDYSLRLKQQLGGPASVWVAAYSNDVMGYIPTERVLRERGYEGAAAMRVGIHPGPWAAGLEEQIVAKVIELDRLAATPKSAVAK